MIKKFYFLAVLLSLLFGQSVAMAEGGGDLWRLANNKGSIKVFINDPVNESGQGQIIPDNLKKALESALINRKTVKFEMVKTPEDSDVRIATVIKKFQYMEKGPFKPTPSIGITLLDAAATMTENYAEMTVNFVVTKSQPGEILWKETLSPYVKKRMSPEESISFVSDKVASHFVWKCFGKPAD